MKLEAPAVEAFHRDGFLAIERLVDEAALAELRAATDEILERKVQAPGDRWLGGLTRQVKFPSLSHPAFAHGPALEAGLEIMRQLHPGRCVARIHDMLICKPPGHPHETPWHQDAAYTLQPMAAAGTSIALGTVQLWLALDDADLENGCMQFLPGWHQRPLLEHVVAAGDPEDEGRLLALRDPARQLDLSRAVACPLQAGGCTLHTPGTPHYTGPNRSGVRPRRAYIFMMAAGDDRVLALEQAVRQSAVAAGVLRAEDLRG